MNLNGLSFSCRWPTMIPVEHSAAQPRRTLGRGWEVRNPRHC